MFGNQFQGVVEVNEVYLSGNELTQYWKDRKALNADNERFMNFFINTSHKTYL